MKGTALHDVGQEDRTRLMATRLVNALARQRALAKVIDILVPAAAVLVAHVLGDGTRARVITLRRVLLSPIPGMASQQAI